MQRHTNHRQVDLFAASAERVYTVSQLCQEVRILLESQFALVRVVGELSDPTLVASGHLYFTLKDERAVFPAVMFRSSVSRLGAVPPEGTEIEVLGRLTLYEPRGRAQLIVEWLTPLGTGRLSAQTIELMNRLRSEGLFDQERKRPLPFLPRCVGVVTSARGAAVHDILTVLGRRFPSISVLIADVRVQGASAAQEIAAAITRLGDGSRCDVMIVTRGGGSAEDLQAFNQEAVVRAVAATSIPVVSAVGHEVDMVLCDLAADLRAPTPTAAATLVVPDRCELQQQQQQKLRSLWRALELIVAKVRRRLLEQRGRLRDPRLLLGSWRLRLDEGVRAAARALQRLLADKQRRVADVRVRLAGSDPRARLQKQRFDLRQRRDRLQHAWQSMLGGHRTGVLGQQQRLQTLNPLAVLGRGYSVVFGPDRRVVSDAAALSPGDVITVRLQRGTVDSRVEEVHPSGEDEETKG
jgi:exodeoxyribonuclease VII large subunit